MIAKDLIPGMGANPFAIMKDAWQREACRAAGDGAITWAEPGDEGFHDGRRLAGGPGWSVTSMARRRDRLTFSHSTPFPFPRMSVHITGGVKAEAAQEAEISAAARFHDHEGFTPPRL